MIGLASAGEAPYAKEVWERMDGKVPDKLDVVSEVKINVTYHDEGNDEPDA